MYNTFNTEIPNILIKEEKDVSNNFDIKIIRKTDPKNIELIIDHQNKNKILSYINQVYIPDQLKNANVEIGKKDKIIQNILIEYKFRTKNYFICYTYKQFLTKIPEIYEGELPFKDDEQVYLEIIFHIKVDVEKISRHMLFWNKEELIKVCDNKLIVYKKFI